MLESHVTLMPSAHANEEAPLAPFLHFSFPKAGVKDKMSPLPRPRSQACAQGCAEFPCLSLPCPSTRGVPCSLQKLRGVLALWLSVPSTSLGPVLPERAAGLSVFPTPRELRLLALLVIIFTKFHCGLWIINYSFQVRETYFIHSYLRMVCSARPYYTLIQILL